MIVAETLVDRRFERRGQKLQWGRDLIVAETLTVTLPHIVANRFNGAAT